MRVTLALVLEDGRSLQTNKAGADLSFIWTRPTLGEIEALQKESVELLAKSIPSASALSREEMFRLGALLKIEETSRTVTLDQALAALKQRQIEGIEGSHRLEEVLVLVFNRWRTDPAVIAFYSDALRERGPEAISDLNSSLIWDDSFVELIVQQIEKAAQSPVNIDALSRGVNVLDRHYASWTALTSVPPRLTRAIVEIHAALGLRSGTAFYRFADLLAKTHDRAAIGVLRPFLSDKTIDHYTSLSSNMPAGRTPMRYSELAANGILRLLGEPILFDPWKRAVATGIAPYPEWAEWDRKIATLQQRLDAMPKR